MTYLELLSHLLTTINTILTHYAPKPSGSAVRSMWDTGKIDEYLDNDGKLVLEAMKKEGLARNHKEYLKMFIHDAEDVRWGLANETSRLILRERLERVGRNLKTVIGNLDPREGCYIAAQFGCDVTSCEGCQP
jgi:hypothetical protein